MLNQTKETKDILIMAGINKKDLIVRTKLNHKFKGYENSGICVFYSEKYFKFKIIRNLLKFFNVTISIYNNKPSHLFIEYNYSSKGKLKIFDVNKNDFTRF